MIYFKVILICLATLSVQAEDSCVPAKAIKIDANAQLCENDCVATAVFSGLRTGAVQYLTIDLIADQYDEDTSMTLTFVTDKEYNLLCNAKSVQRIDDSGRLHCAWKLRLESTLSISKNQVTDQKIWGDLLFDSSIPNTIYFGINGHKSQIASGLKNLVEYNDLFPDCTESDTLSFVDPKQLNEITLSKKSDSITIFINSRHSGDEVEGVNRRVIFTNSGEDEFNFECLDDFTDENWYVTRGHLEDYQTEIDWNDYQNYPSIGKCGITVPLKIKANEYGYEFDFTKKPLNMIFETSQPDAEFTQSDIKFKSDE